MNYDTDIDWEATPSGSRTHGELHAIWPRALRLGRPRADPNTACTLLMKSSRVAPASSMFHAHIDWLLVK